MSDFYLINENHEVFTVDGGEWVRALVHNDVIFVYWRSSTVVSGIDTTSQIKVTTSANGLAWTAPVVAWEQASRDVAVAGVVHDGTKFVMIVGETTSGNVVSTRRLTSTDGTAWTSQATITWTENWAHPTDLVWDGTYLYMAGSVRIGGTGPRIATVRRSDINATSWTSLGYVSQLTATDNVHARIAIDGASVHLLTREGSFTALDAELDRILYAKYDLSWGPTLVVTDGTGTPDWAPITDGWAVAYQDTLNEGLGGIWSWMFFDGETFTKRGAFTQGNLPGAGAAVFPLGSAFATVYTVKPEATAVGTMYFRSFNLVTTEPSYQFKPQPIESVVKPDPDRLDNFSVEISLGSVWLSLTDGFRFYVSAEDYGDKAQILRRVTASSPYFDGEYLVHSTKANVNEMLTVGILGSSQNEVTENQLLLETAIEQPSFQIRFMMGDHVETWSCQAADYTLSRGHIMMHNVRALMKLSIPRLPDVTYEVV